MLLTSFEATEKCRVRRSLTSSDDDNDQSSTFVSNCKQWFSVADEEFSLQKESKRVARFKIDEYYNKSIE